MGLRPLGRHAPYQPALLADPHPSGPAVVAAAVRVDDGERPLVPVREGLEQRQVRELGRRARSDRPCDGHPVEAVDDGAEVDLGPRWEPELRDVGGPRLVRLRRVEVPAHVGAVAAAAPPAVGDIEPLLAHHPVHALLAGGDARRAQARPHAAVALDPAALLEEPRRLGPYVGVAVAPQPGAVALMGALRDPRESGDRAEGQAGLPPRSLS